MAASVDQVLMRFVVLLVTDDAFRARYHDPAQREALMAEKRLSEKAKKALREHDANGVNRLLNQQIVSTFQPRKGRSKAAAPKGARKAAPRRAKSAKKPAAKKR